MTIHLSGRVTGLYRTVERDSFLTGAVDALELTFEGIPGDRHAGFFHPSDSRRQEFPRGTLIRNTRQVSLVADEDLKDIAAKLGVAELRPEWLGANVLVEGIPFFSFLPPGTRLYFSGEAVIAIEGENNPCKTPGRIVQQFYPESSDLPVRFVEAAFHRRGLVGWVERPGRILAGEPVEVVVPEQILYPQP